MRSKKFYTTFFLLFSAFLATAGNLHDGVYLCESDLYGIIIKKDSAMIVRASNVLHSNEMDTIARASYKYINDEFISLEAPATLGYLTSEAYTQSEEKVGMTDVSVEICTPNYNDCLQIIYMDSVCNIFEVVNNSLFQYKQKNQGDQFCFEIMNPNPEYNVDGTSWSTFSYTISVKLDRDKNSHKIVLPNVTEENFRLIEVDNDYIRVANDELTWRGIVFKRVKREIL